MVTSHFQRPGRRGRRTGLHLVAMMVVLLAQVLPCVLSMSLAATPQAHCHEDGGAMAGGHAPAGTPSCKHCLWLAEPSSSRDLTVAGDASTSHPDFDAPLPDTRQHPAVTLLRIDKAHPPPRLPLERTLRHRVLLI